MRRGTTETILASATAAAVYRCCYIPTAHGTTTAATAVAAAAIAATATTAAAIATVATAAVFADSYAQVHESKKAQETYEEMMSEGVAPDQKTLSHMIMAHSWGCPNAMYRSGLLQSKHGE